jgi:sucrose phosphorylase
MHREPQSVEPQAIEPRAVEPRAAEQLLPRGVMLNAYPDSVGGKLSDLVTLLKRPELADAFSL